MGRALRVAAPPLRAGNGSVGRLGLLPGPLHTVPQRPQDAPGLPLRTDPPKKARKPPENPRKPLENPPFLEATSDVPSASPRHNYPSHPNPTPAGPAQCRPEKILSNTLSPCSEGTWSEQLPRFSDRCIHQIAELRHPVSRGREQRKAQGRGGPGTRHYWMHARVHPRGSPSLRLPAAASVDTAAERRRRPQGAPGRAADGLHQQEEGGP
jgi:hypothetical protein